jgi:hypothetical protein
MIHPGIVEAGTNRGDSERDAFAAMGPKTQMERCTREYASRLERTSGKTKAALAEWINTRGSCDEDCVGLTTTEHEGMYNITIHNYHTLTAVWGHKAAFCNPDLIPQGDRDDIQHGQINLEMTSGATVDTLVELLEQRTGLSRWDFTLRWPFDPEGKRGRTGMMIDPTEPSQLYRDKTLRELGIDGAHKELFLVGASMKVSDKVLQETIMNIAADAETESALGDMHNLDAAKAILTAQLVDDHHRLISKMQGAEGDQVRSTQEEIIRLHRIMRRSGRKCTTYTGNA